MKLPLQIAVRNTTLSREMRQIVRRRANKLNRYYDRVTACRVMVEIPQRHRIGTPIGYNVRVDLTVPGGELVVKRQPRAALRAAVKAASGPGAAPPGVVLETPHQDLTRPSRI